MEFESDEINIKPYTLKELAAIYKMTVRAFKRMISDIQQELGPKNGRYYSIIQVKLILERKGIPGRMKS
jgi:hypothetical protein